ncbi:L-type lectin-domain containing receptor kinase S.1 [Linum perenne]
METLLKLGLACCHPDPARRPDMKEVAAVLVREDDASVPPPTQWRSQGESTPGPGLGSPGPE